MTTLVQDLNAALVALAPAGGVFNAANTAGQPVYPYIVFLRVVSTANVSLGGPSDLQNTRFQIDVFDLAYGNGAALAERVKQALLTAFPTCVPISAFDVYEDLIQAYRVSADYSIWSTN